MKNPYFSVGEEAILCSVMHPELNGECKIIAVYTDLKDKTDFVKKANNMPNAFFSNQEKCVSYELTIVCPVQHRHGLISLWNESALRKKHKPSEESFEDMILNLNGIVEEA